MWDLKVWELLGWSRAGTRWSPRTAVLDGGKAWNSESEAPHSSATSDHSTRGKARPPASGDFSVNQVPAGVLRSAPCALPEWWFLPQRVGRLPRQK